MLLWQIINNLFGEKKLVKNCTKLMKNSENTKSTENKNKNGKNEAVAAGSAVDGGVSDVLHGRTGCSGVQ